MKKNMPGLASTDAIAAWLEENNFPWCMDNADDRAALAASLHVRFEAYDDLLAACKAALPVRNVPGPVLLSKSELRGLLAAVAKAEGRAS